MFTSFIVLTHLATSSLVVGNLTKNEQESLGRLDKNIRNLMRDTVMTPSRNMSREAYLSSRKAFTDHYSSKAIHLWPTVRDHLPANSLASNNVEFLLCYYPYAYSYNLDRLWKSYTQWRLDAIHMRVLEDPKGAKEEQLKSSDAEHNSEKVEMMRRLPYELELLYMEQHDQVVLGHLLDMDLSGVPGEVLTKVIIDIWRQHPAELMLSAASPTELTRRKHLARVLFNGDSTVPESAKQFCQKVDKFADDADWRIAETARRLKIWFQRFSGEPSPNPGPLHPVDHKPEKVEPNPEPVPAHVPIPMPNPPVNDPWDPSKEVILYLWSQDSEGLMLRVYGSKSRAQDVAEALYYDNLDIPGGPQRQTNRLRTLKKSADPQTVQSADEVLSLFDKYQHGKLTPRR